MGFIPTGYSATKFQQRYAANEAEIWPGMSRRVAKQAALAETPDKIEKYENRFFEVINENLFVPGGRILANSGKLNAQLLNCFVLGNDLDSAAGWGGLANEMVVTSMAGGGCGIDFSAVRPRGADINGSKGKAPGSVELMKGINGLAKPIKAGGDRRAALMFSLDLDHPDIMEFLDAKLVKGELTEANVSVRSKRTTEFMNAVKANGDWELSWKGKYNKVIKAKDLWDRIVQNAWNSAEPGFLNWELALRDSTVYYIGDLVTTNPCGEIGMTPYDACCLGHLVLPRFIVDGVLDKELLANTIRTGVRFLDNILTVNTFPLPIMKETCNKLRRIGLGTTGLGDMLALMGYRYGSKEANKIVDDLYKFISKIAYESSVMLAVEKGPFELCDPAKHLKSGYMKRMTKKIRSLVAEHGIRNCALLTQAPTGTVSIISDNCSSGIEPMFSPAYERTAFEGDVRKTTLVIHPLCQKFLDEGKDISHFVGASDISIEEHMEVQKIVQRHMDNAVSKTINMAENHPVDQMGSSWFDYLPYLKGVTFYRENSRNYIDENGVEHQPPLKPIPLEEALKRMDKEKYEIEAAEANDCPKGVCEI